MPKFSVLLPTRNRLELLQYAVQSVLRQHYADWEIIISDNFSDEDIAGYVHSLDDNRIRYYRTESFVPVTDNWNNSLRYATGDYIIMLGDDDCLMPDFFTKMDSLIEQFNQPEIIYTDAYIYGYPGVLPSFATGYLKPHYNRNYFGTGEPFLVDRATALTIVEESLSFKMPVLYNMQLSVVRRSFANSLVQPFFQSPFPDYYATVTAFLKAQHILIYQQPVVTIGINAKSYGFFHFNDKQKEGVSFLNNVPTDQDSTHLANEMLPGEYELNCWFLAMQTLAINYPDVLQKNNLKVNYQAYRFRQIDNVYRGYLIDSKYSAVELRELEAYLTESERHHYGAPRRVYYMVLGTLKKFLPLGVMRVLRQLRGKRSLFDDRRAQVSGFNNILDVFERMPSKYDV